MAPLRNPNLAAILDSFWSKFNVSQDSTCFLNVDFQSLSVYAVGAGERITYRPRAPEIPVKGRSDLA